MKNDVVAQITSLINMINPSLQELHSLNIGITPNVYAGLKSYSREFIKETMLIKFDYLEDDVQIEIYVKKEDAEDLEFDVEYQKNFCENSEKLIHTLNVLNITHYDFDLLFNKLLRDYAPKEFTIKQTKAS